MTTFTTTLSADPALKKVVTDAESLGQVIASDALVFAHSVIGHISGATPGIVADVTSAALSAFYDAVPANSRGVIQAVVGALSAGAVANLDAAGTNEALGVLGLVSTRISAWITSFTPTAK